MRLSDFGLSAEIKLRQKMRQAQSAIAVQFNVIALCVCAVRNGA
jgi:hypothetical protein